MSVTVEAVDLKRRRILTAATTVVGAVGAGFVAVPFLASWQPSARAKAAGAPVQIDIGKLDYGQLIRVEWRGKPVWVVKRTEEALQVLADQQDKLRDPASDESEQPENCKNPHRSVKDEIFIAVGICTHLGCSPTYRPEIAPPDLGPEWEGGFFCPCHGSLFDLAGRVYKGVPAPLNLVVPPHRYLDSNTLVVGEEGVA